METWYIMEDGSCGDPREISADGDGKLRHKDGRAVAYAPHGPRSRGVDPEAERAKVGQKSQNPEPEPEPEKSPEEQSGLDLDNASAVTPDAEVGDVTPSADGDKSHDVETSEVTPEKPKRGYKTRESKSG